ncbi:hypothetical protein NRB20_51850 [Nocardia sp. RB20]|uniref:HTH tetR-type domain-containing protein n=2 Tax=Nocardia macrotermitis TaxID=2585198 RepID=A0A7K0D9S4_9NOCA|nr:hypothetical protein [Nocardia macrotermitis]
MRDRPCDRLSVREIATGAEASTTSIYTLFGSRENLIAAVRTRACVELGEVLGAVPATRDPVEDLLAIAAEYRRWALANRHRYASIFGGGVSYVPHGAPRDGDPAAALVDVVNRAHGPEYRIEDANRTAVAIWAALHGFITFETDGTLHGSYIDTVVPHAIRSLLAG